MPKTNVDLVAVQYRKFNDFVRGELNRQNYTMSNLADYLGLSYSSISYKLSGKVDWSLKEALATLEFLNAEGSDFL